MKKALMIIMPIMTYSFCNTCLLLFISPASCVGARWLQRLRLSHRSLKVACKSMFISHQKKKKTYTAAYAREMCCVISTLQTSICLWFFKCTVHINVLYITFHHHWLKCNNSLNYSSNYFMHIVLNSKFIAFWNHYIYIFIICTHTHTYIYVYMFIF